MRGEETGTKASQVVSRASSLLNNVTIMHMELIFHGNFSVILMEHMNNFNFFIIIR